MYYYLGIIYYYFIIIYYFGIIYYSAIIIYSSVIIILLFIKAKKMDRGFIVPGPLVFNCLLLEQKLLLIDRYSFPIQECDLSTLR